MGAFAMYEYCQSQKGNAYLTLTIFTIVNIATCFDIAAASTGCRTFLVGPITREQYGL